MDDRTMESSMGNSKDKVPNKGNQDKHKVTNKANKGKKRLCDGVKEMKSKHFSALKDGFRVGGRDLLGLDGAFMKVPYEGQLLIVVSVNANNGIYPVAYGIVESESLDSWLWFLTALGDDLGLYLNLNFTFITDRQKGLLPAIKRLFPSAEHRYCVRHICENINSTWRGGAYKEMLWNYATATTIVQFNKGMDVWKSYNIKAYELDSKIMGLRTSIQK
ncbi:mutator type transposase, partial [Tanacetum coccineum]